MGEQGFLAFLVDDGTLSADFDTLCKIVRFIERDGSKYGFSMNKSKGSYCLGNCDSYQIAIQRKQKLIDMGLSLSSS